MSLEMVDGPEQIARRMHAAIAEAIPGAEIEVLPASPGHYAIRVRSAEFEGLSRVRQQQRVYAAITPFLVGDDAPVHAVDELVTEAA